MENIYILEIKFQRNGNVAAIYPTLIADGDELVLIDAAYPGQVELIRKAAEEVGIMMEDITQVVITHHDVDHMGTAAELKRLYPHLRIVASETERPYIEGSKKHMRLEQAERMLEEFPEGMKLGPQGLVNRLKSLEKVVVTDMVSDGDFLPNCPHIQVVGTEGHMPGHISIYDTRSKTLVSGDALIIQKDELLLSLAEFTFDMPRAKESGRKLAAMDIEHIICYHGGEYEGDCDEALRRITNNE